MQSVRISILLAAAVFASAAAPVEDAAPVRSATITPVDEPRTRDATTGDGIGTLFHQLQILQDEVRRLQGVIEEQNYRIERLVGEQRERYIELDQRLLALRPGAARPPGATASGVPEAATPAAAPAAQSDAYNRAFAIVTQARQLPPSERAPEYARALVLFGALIADHPDGEFVPNAYYWTGELHLATDDLEQARQAFAQVANLYGDHAKAPDALYKLGVTYHRLGDNILALQYLDRVVDEYAGHTSADLARSYAAELR